MRITNITDAKASLSKLVERVLRGEEVVIGKAGRPVARIVPYDLDTSPRDLSVRIWEGEVWMADDFDELPEEVLKHFTSEVEDDTSEVEDDEPPA